MSAHSTLGPSAAKRWLNCPGSVAKIALLPRQPSSKYAAEGTVAHTIAEEFLTGKASYLQLVERIGEIVKTKDGFDVEITEEMLDGAVDYKETIEADHKVMETLGRPNPIVLGVEERVHATSIDEDVWGTSDAWLYQLGNSLIVYDYKYGKGVVEAEANDQGLCYVIGVLDKLGPLGVPKMFPRLRFTIHQPRAGGVRTWDIAWSDVEAFRKRAGAAAKRTRDADAPLVAGEWCRSSFCPLQSVCPAARSQVMAAAQVDFDVIPAGPTHKANGLPDVKTMPVEKLVAAMRWQDVVESWFVAVKNDLEARLNAGENVPGMKLVEGRSSREWIDDAKTVGDLSPVLGKDALYTKPELLSPAQLEKKVGKGKLDHLIRKVPGRKSVAFAEDPRPAAPSRAQDDFTAIEKPRVVSDLDALEAELAGEVKKVWA